MKLSYFLLSLLALNACLATAAKPIKDDVTAQYQQQNLVATDGVDNDSSQSYSQLFELPQSVASGTSLIELYQIALKNNPNLVQSQANYAASLAQVEQARAAYRPKASATLSAQRSTSEENDRNIASLSLTQPLYNPAFAQLEVAKQSAKVQKTSILSQTNQLILELIQNWVTTLIAEQSLAISDIEIRTNKSLFDKAKQSLEVGVGRIVDVAEAESAYRLALATQIQRQSEFDLALENLSNTVGQAITDIPAWQNHDQRIQMEQLVFSPLALQQNLNLKQAKQRLDLSRVRTEAATRGLYPNVQLSLAYNYTELIKNNLVSDPLELTLSANWEFYSGGQTEAEISQNQQLLQASQANLQATYNQQQIALKQLISNLRSNIQRLPALEAQQEAKKIALDSYNQGYQLGSETLPDLLTAQSAYQQTQLSVIQTRYSLWSNYAELLFVMNRLSTAELR